MNQQKKNEVEFSRVAVIVFSVAAIGIVLLVANTSGAYAAGVAVASVAVVAWGLAVLWLLFRCADRLSHLLDRIPQPLLPKNEAAEKPASPDPILSDAPRQMLSGDIYTAAMKRIQDS